MPKPEKTKEQLIIDNRALTEKVAGLKIENSHLAKSFHNAVEKHIDGIIITDSSGIIQYVNIAAEKMFGYPKEKLIGEIFGIPVITGEFVEMDIICRNGIVGIGEIRSSDIEWEGEKSKLLSIRDITKHKRSQQIQTIIHKISNATISSDGLEKLYNVIKEEVSKVIDTTNYYIATYNELTNSISLQYFVDENDRIETLPAGKTMTSYVVKTKKSLLATETKQNQMADEGLIEFVGTRSKVWLGVPLKTADKITGVLVVQSYNDENAFDNSDKELLEIIADQISISIDRKRSEEALKKALLNATESDRLKSAFLATMSHELRTPLNAVIGFSEILSYMDYSKEVTEYAKIISSSGSNLLNIIEEIFDITLIESGEITVRKTKGNLNTYLNSIHESASVEQQRLKQTHISLNVILPKENEDLIINVDFPKLKHILLNLIKNGLKFSKKGHVTYGYNLILDDKQNPMIKFFVEDTGIGIPAESQKQIFIPFRHVEETNTRRYGGTGVGLSISKRLIELLGGEIWLTSELGVGSTFFFTIPFNNDNSDTTLPNNLNSKLALIVEDDEYSYEFLKIILEDYGMKTLHAKNGKKAISSCKEYPDIDVILLDVNMPVMNGLEAAREIRKFNKDVKIIAQTAYAFEENKNEAIDSGCDDFITKPIMKNSLLRIVKKYVK